MNSREVFKRVGIIFLLVLSLFFFTDKSDAEDFYWQMKRPYNGKFQDNSKRLIYLLNQDWKYLEENISTVELLKNASKDWQKIDLPHTWNQWDATDNEPGYRRDIGWYKKGIFVPDFKMPRVLRLYFEGVNISTEVYVNGRKAGEHVGGYLGFKVDITGLIKKGKTNYIRVKVDNSINREIIPSQKSDFFIYGGITRDVWLEVLPSIYIDNIHVRTQKVDSISANTELDIEIVNSLQKKNVPVSIRVHDPRGTIVVEKKIESNLTKGKTKVTVEIPAINEPFLWSPDTPNLYTVSVTVDNDDRAVERFGYRWFEFKKYGPFYLNGKRLLLRGTHRHEDFAGYANAMPDSLHRKDIQMIKDMGANFVRLAHYPQDPEVYRACDELGLIVWDELPWCRGGVGDLAWQANSKRLFEEQIRQNFNHPSILFWSIGNEIYWLPDYPGGDNPDSLRAFAKTLNDLAHKLDPGRLTTIRKFYDGADITDFFSPSIWAGWYSGVYKKYEKAINSASKKYKRFFHAEYGGSSHVGRHTENPITGDGLVREDEWTEKPNMIEVTNIANAGDWSENYIVDLFDWHLMINEKLENFTGNAQWAFKDFPTPLRPENPIPYINQKGLVDRSGKPKDAFYVFMSRWTDTPKFCYIESHTWTERTGIRGESKEVNVYSNCDSIELFLDGKKQGLRKRNIMSYPASGFSWSVEFELGKNKLMAIGYSGQTRICSDSLSVNYSFSKHGKPEEIKLTARPLSSGNILVQAFVLDNEGNLCLDFKERAYFSQSGDGRLLHSYGTPTRSNVIEFANGKASIEFVPEPGKQATIEVRTQNFKGSYLYIN